MKVVTFKTTEGKVRYLLVDAGGVPVEEVKQFLRFEDKRGMARNTLKQKCIHLKHFYTFLQQKRIKYRAVTVDDLAAYIAWLKYLDISEKVIPLNMEPRFREQCINANVDTIIGFYNYLLMHEDLENTLSEKLVKFVRTPGKGYRSFLYGIAENKRQKRYLLHLPVPKNVLRTVTKEDVNDLLKATSNVRDYFLLYLLFETGMRIGEALSLWLEDIDISECVDITTNRLYYIFEVMIMQISSRFTIAIHIFACVDTFGSEMKITSDFLAGSINTNPVIIRKLLSQLKDAGLIEVKRGPGGIDITRPLEKITFLDIYKAVECIEDEKLFHFHENPNPECPVGKNIHNVLDDKLQSVQEAMEKKLASITLADVKNDLIPLL